MNFFKNDRSPVKSWLITLGIFIGSFVVFSWVYRSINITLFRAESGVYLNIAASDNQTILNFIIHQFRYSYNGHYTPILFSLELLFSRWFGTQSSLWLLRQLILLAALATVLIYLCSNVLELVCRNKKVSSALAIALASIFMFQPGFIEMVSWPFMGLQLMWLFLTVLALHFLVLFTKAPNNSIHWLWLATGTAYASMHALGTGLVTSVGMAMCLAIFLVLAWTGVSTLQSCRKQLLLALVALSILTVLHAYCMVALDPSPKIAETTAPLGIIFERFGGFTAVVIHAVLRSLWSPNGYFYPKADWINYEWIYGWGFILILIVFGIQMFVSVRQYTTTRRLVQLTLYTFSVTAFLFIISMVIYRLRAELLTELPLGYLIGTRYLIPYSLIVIGIILAIFLCFRLSKMVSLWFLSLIVIISTVSSHQIYLQSVVPQLWPLMNISHQQAWSLMEASVLEARQQNLPILDLRSDSLIEFKGTIRIFEPLLRESLHIPRQEKLSWINSSAMNLEQAQAYYEKCPSFLKLENMIKQK